MLGGRLGIGSKASNLRLLEVGLVLVTWPAIFLMVGNGSNLCSFPPVTPYILGASRRIGSFLGSSGLI